VQTMREREVGDGGGKKRLEGGRVMGGRIKSEGHGWRGISEKGKLEGAGEKTKRGTGEKGGSEKRIEGSS